MLAQIRLRLKMLESTAPPERRDKELRRRIGEVKVEEDVVLSKLSELGSLAPTVDGLARNAKVEDNRTAWEKF